MPRRMPKVCLNRIFDDYLLDHCRSYGWRWVERVVLPSRAAESNSRQNKYFKWKKSTFLNYWDKMKGNSINNCNFSWKFVIYVRSVHCDYSPPALTNPNYATASDSFMSTLLAEVPLCYPWSRYSEYVRERLTCNTNDSHYFSRRSRKKQLSSSLFII